VRGRAGARGGRVELAAVMDAEELACAEMGENLDGGENLVKIHAPARRSRGRSAAPRRRVSRRYLAHLGLGRAFPRWWTIVDGRRFLQAAGAGENLTSVISQISTWPCMACRTLHRSGRRRPAAIVCGSRRFR
jgi:hypothetical protein